MSNRLTFSLASLIFLIAFGFIFGTTDVMAHTDADRDTNSDGDLTDFAADGDIGTHTHPVKVAITHVAPAPGPPVVQGRLRVPLHNAHPTATISLKAGDNVSGNTVAVDATDNPTFTILVTFSADVANSNNQASIIADGAGDNTENDDLASGEYTSSLFNTKNANVDISGQAITRVGTGANQSKRQFQIVVTPSAYPSGTADAADETLTYRIQVHDNAVYGVQTREIPPGQVAPIDVAGGGNSTSDIFTVTLVKTLPVIPDTTPPKVTTFAATLSGGVVTGKITFSKALGSGANGVDLQDLMITGGTAVASTTAAPNPSSNAARTVWTVKVTPTNTAMPEVTISIRDDAQIYDDSGNPLDFAGSAGKLSDSVDEVHPMALSGSATKIAAPAGAPAGTYLAFKFTFNEAVKVASLDEDAIDQSVSHNVTINTNYLNARRATGDPNDTITITVRATNPSADSSVTLKSGMNGVEDMAGNTLAESFTATYTVPGPREPTNPTITITAADYLDSMGNVVGLNCLSGNVLTFPPDVTLGANEAVAASEVSVTAPANSGWGITTSGDDIMVVPLAGRNRLNVTEITVTVAAGAVKDTDGDSNDKTEQKFTVGPVLTIPANGYIVVVRTSALEGFTSQQTHLRQVPTLRVGDPNVGSADVTVQTWDCMPDLGVLLGRTNYDVGKGRGLLVVKGGGGLMVQRSPEDSNPVGIGNGTVVINEIMWAIDRSKLFGAARNYDHAQEQWIELYNQNSREVKVTLFDLELGEAFSSISYGEIDRMTNYNLPQHHGGWAIRNNNKGQDGDSDYGEDFVAMQRTAHKGDFDGRDAARWSAATAEYLVRTSDLANTGQLALDNLNYQFIGTPGRSNSIGTSNPPGVTNVPLKPFVISEVGNRENRLYEWIELRNTSGAEANLRNYHLSMVRGINNEVGLFTFPNSDIKVPANGLVLILTTDPEDDGEHPIAVGHDIRGGNDQAPGVNADSARYIVANRNEGLYTTGLPDGNFVLILRRPDGHDKAGTASNKRGGPNNIIDVAGYATNLGNRNSGPKYTSLWPLNGHGAPFSKNNMREGQVWFRRDPGRLHGENNNDKPAFIAYGYTGVGYKRHAQNVPEHGGTPGYHDIRKSLVSQVTKGSVTISEIMFDQGADGRYPQWIELYNSSPTEAVNLHSEAGWRLVINNYDDRKIELGLVSGTLNFRNSEVQTILPQQTVLVASTRARSAGSDTQNASVVFIPTRVFSVWSSARNQFGQSRSTDPILNPEGFSIRLIDGKGTESDRAGNLIQSRGRVVDSLEWKMFKGTTEDGDRTSIIRRYSKSTADGGNGMMGVPEDGTMKEGWVRASVTDLTKYSRGTWYGNQDDHGTPGITGGRVLPVELSTFRPQRLDDDSVVIRWITESEKDNAGFNILRSESRTGEFTKLNTQLIAGKGTTSERTPYEFVDKTAKPNVVYYYQIQDVSLDGDIQTLAVTHLRGHVSAAGKLTTTWGGLKALQ